VPGGLPQAGVLDALQKLHLLPVVGQRIPGGGRFTGLIAGRTRIYTWAESSWPHGS
jgi:hypothetical protein